MNNFENLRVGLFGIGLAAYWEQFAGLEERLKGYVHTVEQRLSGANRDIVNFGLVDSPERALAVSHEARQQDVDILVIYVTTYALSSTVLPIVRRAKVPVLVLNLQPTAALDYAHFNALTDRTAMTGEWLAYCSACPVPELANVFARSGIPFHQVTGVLDDDPECWREIHAWIDAAQVAHTLSHTRVGLMGHYYNGMLDIATDLTAVASIFGTHLEVVEIDELSRMRLDAPEDEVQRHRASFSQAFDIQPDCSASELQRAARTSAALEQFVKSHRLGALAYFYKGSGCEMNEETVTSIILGTSLLTSRGIPVAGEYEIKNVLAMKILDSFGAGGSFTEYYATDFAQDVVLLGHDGPGHAGIAEGKTKVRPLTVYHGKIGRGLSVEMSVKYGPVTLLSVVESKDRGFKLLVAEGQVEAGPILQIGNTNSRYRFPVGARNFIQRWNEQAPAHHCAVGLGHIADKLEKLGLLLNIDVVRIC
ncbi:arabinose isomerase [Edaphobacter paludis]|uniref:Arabinose isomerase n=1 Tax=Edaphobacter paludis TaxID=3035702 RepID=A0AAU7CUK5_9BACT